MIYILSAVFPDLLADFLAHSSGRSVQVLLLMLTVAFVGLAFFNTVIITGAV
jgi:hypothetical protein